MKKFFALSIAFTSLAVAAHAQVTPAPFFFTPPVMQEGFDTTIAGLYTTMPVFGVPASASAIGTGGMLVVSPYPGVVSLPHLMYGRGVDVEIRTLIPMRRFGGYFRSGFFGLFSTTAEFRFYDASNVLIGTPQIVPMTAALSWVGFTTVPKWNRVEIYGNVPGIPGLVGMDSLRIRPF